MGFTLGQKTYIYNTGEQLNLEIKAADPANPGAAPDDTMRIEGFGTFKASEIIAGVTVDPVPAVHSKLADITIPTGAGLGITEDETGVTMKVVVVSTRESAEFGRDYIEKGYNFIVEIEAYPGGTGVELATKFQAAFAAYATKFSAAEMPFTVSRAGAVLTFTINDALKNSDTLSFQQPIFINHAGLAKPIELTGTLVRATEAAYKGSQLEEFMRMSLPDTSDAYSIQAGQLPFPDSLYSMIKWSSMDNWDGSGVDGKYRTHRGLGGTRDEQVGARIHNFLLTFNTDSEGLTTKKAEIATFIAKAIA
jgi:hypothetical protein